MSLNLKLVSSDDWQGLYIADELVEQNHSLRAYDVLQHLANTRVGSFMSFVVREEWIGSQGSLPKFFSDIPEEMLD